jgi:hypothetical protein
MPTTTLDTAALERGWAGLNLLGDADRFKARTFKRAREIINELGLVDPIGRSAIRKALTDALNEILRDAYPAPPPRAAAGRSIDEEFSCQGDTVDPASATLHASALRWIELGDGDPNDADTYVEAIEAIEALNR